MSRAVMQRALDALVDVARDLASSQCEDLYAALGHRSPRLHDAAKRELEQIDGAIESLSAALVQQPEPMGQVFPVRRGQLESDFFRAAMQLVVGVEQGHAQLLSYAERVRKALDGVAAPVYVQPAPVPQDEIRNRLTAVLRVVRRYLPPDGISVQSAMSEIIALVDPWPLQPAPVAQPLTEDQARAVIKQWQDQDMSLHIDLVRMTERALLGGDK